ncbi:MerR family transcriptional regulator [Kineosporia sp. NBRC 101731]|uniref:MerR family transcriptional regulator n=1 Tax=Kineosporia sp. NBRC 101731 TaxID=3032199 RepID=UPI0024A5D874|nr:MerR family transcriptional regulator [Kineosporia sp. NBRC 101731]GLY29843.1 MerR family transcriptional regulator [Kineosporia sp. NBRC 101731]
MITISQLARHAGVTVRAVRHYHQIGLLPEAERDASGYRTYGAAAVVRLIRIRTLADAGVPLARVQELLDADDAGFARGVQEIDKELRSEIRRLQDNRTRIARLAAGDHLALPAVVVSYLDRLRALGINERYLDLERPAWIMLAAQVPEQIDDIVARKNAELEDADMVQLYRLLSEAIDWSPDEPRIVEIADVLERLMFRAVEAGESGAQGLDDPFVQLMDAAMSEASPISGRILKILQGRGWKGWTRIEQAPSTSPRP